MVNCKYTVNVDGQVIEFSSEMELDSFLKTHKYELIASSKAKKTYMSMDPQESALARLEEAAIDLNSAQIEYLRNSEDTGEVETIYVTPNSIGVSRTIEFLGKLDKFTTPFNLEVWREGRIAHWVETGLNQTEAQEKVQLEENSWVYIQHLGTEVHNYFDSLATGKEFTPKLLTEELISSLKIQYEEAINQIKRDLKDDNIKVLTEFGLKSKKLTPSQAYVFNQQGYTSINGKIDLLVIDSAGKAHIYDFKLSPKIVGDWSQKDNAIIVEEGAWPSSKKEAMIYQMSFYAAMLEQYGFKNVQTNIIPIKVDLDRDIDGFTVKQINNITINKTIDITTQARTGLRAARVRSYISGAEFDNDALVSESLVRTSELYKTLFPMASASFQVRRLQKEYDYYRDLANNFVYAVKENDQNYGKYKYTFQEIGLDNKRVYCESDEELETKLKDYVARLNAHKESEMTILAENIDKAINGTISVEDVGLAMTEGPRFYLLNQIKKYIDGRWEFVKNDDLNSAGMFIFRKDGRSEIVMVSNLVLGNILNFPRGSSILGKFKSDRNINRRLVASSSNGNLEIFKALTYINENVDLFKNTKINLIKAINPWTQEVEPSLNSMLLDNWGQLMTLEGKTNKITPNMFANDIDSMMLQAQDLVEYLELKVEDFRFKIEDYSSENTREELELMLRKLRSRYLKLTNENNFVASDPAWQLYMTIREAISILDGYGTRHEPDRGAWFGGDMNNIMGLMTSSPQTSPSANILTLGNIFMDYQAEVGREYDKITFPVIEAMKAFYKANGQMKALGGEAGFYLSWFQDLDTLTLKDPEGPDFNGQPEARKALRLFLDTMAQLKYHGNEAAIAEAKVPGGDYYQLPLLEAKFARQSKRLGYLKAFKNKIRENWDVVEGVWAGKNKAERQGYIEEKRNFEQLHHKLYNRFDIKDKKKRMKLIEDHGSGFFETDVERVFREAAFAYVKQKVSGKYLGDISAMRMRMTFMKDVEGHDMKNIRDTFDKMVKKVIHGEPIIEEKLLPLHRLINVVKMGFSKMALGFNPRSFAREVLQGTWIGASRAMVEKIPGVDWNTYRQGYQWVVQHAKDNIDQGTLVRQLGSTYRMANMSLTEMADQKRINWAGIRNWDSDTLFLTSTSPDFLHRTTILIAKMIGDGCLEAHSLSEDGLLKYDWKKDKRFEHYVKGETSHKDYLFQKTLYLKNIEEWNKKGMKLKEGDDLPQAYTVREAATYKNWGDILYGHYDSENKALINSTFLGSMFMQYRTFVTAKLEQWFQNPGVYNQDLLKQQFDEETGEELWEVMVYPDDEQEGIYRKVVKASEVTDEEKNGGFAQPYIRWEGDPLEGMAYSMVRFIKAFRDPEELKRMWQNPFERGQLFLGLHDLLFMMMLGLIIKALFGKETVENIKEQDWITQFSYQVLYGSVQDGPFYNVLGTMFRDLNPPVVGSIKRLGDAAVRVINSDEKLTSAMLGLVDQVGMIRELQGPLRVLQNN